MWLTKRNMTIIFIMIIVVIISYLSYIFIPTTMGEVMNKYIDTEEIVKMTFIIDKARKDDMPYHILDEETINLLHDYFYGIEVTHVAAVPYFEETDNFIFYIYDKNGNMVRITSYDGYNGLYLYVQSEKWYEVKNYNRSDEIINEIKGMLEKETAGSDFIGIVPFSDEENREIFGHYIDKYVPLVTKDGLDKLFASGLITYMDDLAYSNDLYARVEKIELDKTEEHEYAYTVKLKLVKDRFKDNK